MTQREFAVLKDVAGMLSQLIENNNQQGGEHDENLEEKENLEEIKFIKSMKSENLKGIKFIGENDKGLVITGSMSGDTINCLFSLFLERFNVDCNEE